MTLYAGAAVQMSSKKRILHRQSTQQQFRIRRRMVI